MPQLTNTPALDTISLVETPEHVSFSFEVAGPVRRVAAYLIDTLVRTIVMFVFAFAALIGEATGGSGLSGVGTGLWLALAFAMEWGYFVVLEMLMSGQSVGKRVLGLRVVTADGRPLGFGASVLRNLVRAADLLPLYYALGLSVLIHDKKFRRLGDLVAGTLVIVEEKRSVMGPLVIEPAPTAQELGQFPHKLTLSRQDLDAMELFLRRLGHYPPAREIELAERLAPILAARMGLRFHNPVRFLQVLYYRAMHKDGHAHAR
jgi:uncharacterized RDD family membrane protein YckC